MLSLWMRKRRLLPLAMRCVVLPAALALSAGAACRGTQTSPPPTRHTVESDGHPLTLWEKRPRDPLGAILLIHGRTWSSLPDFDLQVPGEHHSLMDALVDRGYATYALDLRGYGETPRDSSGFNTPTRAMKDVASVIDWISQNNSLLNPPALFGWSFGSSVAQMYAQRFPKNISSLILFGYWLDPDVTLPLDPQPAKPERRHNTAEAAASDFITPGAISLKAKHAYVKAALDADPIRVDWYNTQEFNTLDPGLVRLPTLLIQGQYDPYAKTQAQARFFARLGTPDRQWVTIPGSDHAALLEDTLPAFVAAIVNFLERPQPARQSR